MIIPKLLLIPIIAVGVTQIIKFIIEAVRHEIRWASLFEYGGMPSAHTAFVVSLTTVIGIHEGINSAIFAVAVVFSLLIIRDAIGLRQFLSLHGRVLNMLIKDLPDDMEPKYPPRLVEKVGHTPLQATIGGLIGLLLGFALYGLIPSSW
jgi:acid phosphatase family membrane protein YuiD